VYGDVNTGNSSDRRSLCDLPAHAREALARPTANDAMLSPRTPTTVRPCGGSTSGAGAAVEHLLTAHEMIRPHLGQLPQLPRILFTIAGTGVYTLPQTGNRTVQPR